MAHNHPSNAYLGLCGSAAKKLWYCHEPHRSLYAAEANPAMAAALAAGRLGRAGPMGTAIAGALRRSRWKRRLSPRHRGRIALDRDGVAGLDAIWANSGATARAVERIYGRAAEVFYPAVRLEPSLPPAAPWERPLRVLVMGGLGAYKGVSVLLDGLALLQKTDPGSLRLEIVGQGRELTELERRAARLGLDQAASFHGFLPDRELADLKTCCHGFAAMPGDEPFGLVFAEAAGAGLVLIGPDHGGPLEILDSGRVGLLANPFDSASIADAFRRFRSLAAEERESLRRMAFTAARERFDLENLGPRLSGRIAALLTGG
jgi:glycosyltransferase involved in cell wall biosynthesis